jgi:raffinose/stachyose/melibiose transport system substrate-binding protein
VKNTRFRKLAVGLAALASVAVALSGCTGGSGAANDGTITWLSARAANDSTVKAVKAIAAEYAKTHPNFKLQVQSISDRPSYDQKVKVLASSNQLPQLWDADPEPYFQQLVKAGKAADIGALYKELGVTDEFYPISIDYPKFDDGSLNLITLNANAEYFWYNKAAFQKAGVTPPKTFAEFQTVLARLKSAGITPLAVNGKDQWPFYRYLGMLPFRETGNAFLDGLRTGKTKMTDPTGIKATTFLQGMGQDFQAGFTNTDYTTAVNLFTSGQTAMLYDGSWELPSFVDSDLNLKSTIGYFTMPTENSSDKTAATDFFANSGIGTAIRKDALTPELKGFLKYFFAHYADTALYQYHVIPSIKPTIKDSLPQVYKDVLNDISKVRTYARVWDVRLDPNTVSVLGRQSGSLLVGQSSPEQFGQQVDDALTQYRQQPK